MPNERTDGTAQSLGHCLIRDSQLVCELLSCAASGNVVISHLNREHQRFSLWLAQAVPRPCAWVRGIVHPNDFRGDVRLSTTDLILGHGLAVGESELEIPPFRSSRRAQYLSLIVQDTLKETILARVPIEPEQGSIFEHIHLGYTGDGWIAFDGIEKPVFDWFVDPKERHGHLAARDERFEFDGRRPIETENLPEIEVIWRYSNFSYHTHTRLWDYVALARTKEEDMVYHVFLHSTYFHTHKLHDTAHFPKVLSR